MSPDESESVKREEKKATASQSSGQAIFGTIRDVTNTFSALLPALAIFLVAYAAATGNLTSLTRYLQGYKITQEAAIDAPTYLGRQSFADFKHNWSFKTFENGQTEHPLTRDNTSVQGDVLSWTFHIHGYAAETYTAYFEDSASGVSDVLCKFSTETVDDSDMVCAYFAPKIPTSPKSKPRQINVWLDSRNGPIAVRAFSLLKR